MKSPLALLALFLSACPAPLVAQQTLAQRVHKATLACVAAPSTPVGVKLCAQAKLCQVAAKAADDSLQAANKATASGNTDVAAEVTAAGQTVLADAACKQGGW